MGERDITPERELHQPGPEEHPGEDGTYVDASRTRLKRRDPEGERLDDAHSAPRVGSGRAPRRHLSGRGAQRQSTRTAVRSHSGSQRCNSVRTGPGGAKLGVRPGASCVAPLSSGKARAAGAPIAVRTECLVCRATRCASPPARPCCC